MEIFNNNQITSYEAIAKSGPRWWLEYREMVAVYRFQGFLLDLVISRMEQVVKNIFPSQADLETLIEYEKLLRIETDEDMSIEERRRVASIYYSGSGKLTGSVIQQFVKVYSGCRSELWWRDKSTLNVRILCDEDWNFSQGKIYRLLDRRMPAHLGFIIRSVLCSFQLEEPMEFDRLRMRWATAWWDGSLNGERILDGSVMLDAKLPPFFSQRYPFRVEHNLSDEIGVFRERIAIDNRPRIAYSEKMRLHMSWWEGTLDGAYKLDGSRRFDAVLPPHFSSVWFRCEVGNENRLENVKKKDRLTVENTPDTAVRDRARISLNWYEEYRTLDGAEKLDGEKMLDQDATTRMVACRHRVKVDNGEAFAFTMYVPARSNTLNGGAALDGTMKLNSGKEEL